MVVGMMETGLPGPLLVLVLVLCCPGSGLGSVLFSYYYYVGSHVSWHDAQSYCRSSGYNADLAIIYRESEAQGLDLQKYRAWIGLYDGPGHGWDWSDGSSSNFRRWANNEPHHGEDCGSVTNDKKFYGSPCDWQFFVFCCDYNSGSYEYTFIPQSMMWQEAQAYCRDAHWDLATFEGSSDLNSAAVPQDFPVWTGLHRDEGAWQWSKGLSDYRNWGLSEPSNKGDCVAISSLGKQMSTQNCSSRFPHVCFRHNLILVKENKTWEEALAHCRALTSPSHRHDLVSLQPGSDQNHVMDNVMNAETDEVWTGLRFLAGRWLWVNGQPVLYPDLPGCPSEEHRCGAIFKNGTDNVATRDCTERKNFLCYFW